MRHHEHSPSESDELRARAPQPEQRSDAVLGRAAAAARLDVLSGSGLTRLQRIAGNAATSALVAEEPSPVLDVVSSGGGRPLEPDVRADMEGRLGHDFGGVRVHDDDRAHESAVAVNAHAYTVGTDVVFQRGTYDPGSHEGRTTLAHELTHVVQQRSGPVDGTPAAGGVRVSDPSDRFEREAAATAERAMAGPGPVTSPSHEALASGGTGAAVQREVDEEQVEEPTAQGLFVQREEAQDTELEEPGG